MLRTLDKSISFHIVILILFFVSNHSIASEEHSLKRDTGKIDHEIIVNELKALSDTIDSVRNLAKTGETKKAESVFRQWANLPVHGKEEENELNTQLLTRLANIFYFHNRYLESERLFSRVAEINSTVYGENHINTLNIHAYIALSKGRQGKNNEANKLFQSVVKRVEIHHGYESVHLSDFLHSAARIHYNSAQFIMAEKYFRRVIMLDEIYEKEEDKALSTARLLLARILTHFDRTHEAALVYKGFLLKTNEKYRQEHPLYHAEALIVIALSYTFKMKYEEAVETYLKCIALHEKDGGPKQAYLSTALAILGSVYTGMKQFDLAEKTIQRSLKIAEENKTTHSYHYLLALTNMIVLKKSENSLKETEKLSNLAFSTLKNIGSNRYEQSPIGCPGSAETRQSPPAKYQFIRLPVQPLLRMTELSSLYA